MGRLALDSDCLIAIFKESDIHHKSIVNRLLQSNDQIFLSAVALSESLVHSYRVNKGAEMTALITDSVDDVLAVDQEIATLAAELRAVSNMKLGDALISATAIRHQCTLLTFDEKLAKHVPGAELLR